MGRPSHGLACWSGRKTRRKTREQQREHQARVPPTTTDQLRLISLWFHVFDLVFSRTPNCRGNGNHCTLQGARGNKVEEPNKQSCKRRDYSRSHQTFRTHGATSRYSFECRVVSKPGSPYIAETRRVDCDCQFSASGQFGRRDQPELA